MISSVVFLGSCNFRCPYCHNKDLVLWPNQLSTIPFAKINDFITAYQDWLDGVVISGGEPCLHPGLSKLLEKFRHMGLKIKLDTNGSRPKVLRKLIRNGLVDYVAMDFKAPLNEFSYRRCTGVWTDIKAIAQSIDILFEANIHYEFRVTVCPGLLDLEDVLSMGKRIQGAKRFILQNVVFRNTLDPSLNEIIPYPKEKLDKMKYMVSPYVKECLVIS